MATEASKGYDRGFADASEATRDEIVEIISDILADTRDLSMENQGYSATWAVDYITFRLDRYIDDMKGVWSGDK